jgi:predicted nucleic acid-binding protein
MTVDKVLIDTSVWILYFRDKSSDLTKKIDEVLATQEVYVPKIVIAELIQGSKSEKEVSVIEEFVNAFNVIDQNEDTWVSAGRLSYQLKRKGKTVNLADCYIAVIAQEHHCRILTLDEHFQAIREVVDIQLIDFTSS